MLSRYVRCIVTGLTSIALVLGLAIIGLVAAPVQKAEAHVDGLVCTDALGGASHYKLKRGSAYTSTAQLGIYTATDHSFLAGATENHAKGSVKLKMKITLMKEYGMGWVTVKVMGPETRIDAVGCPRGKPAAGSCGRYRYKAEAWIKDKHGKLRHWSRTKDRVLCRPPKK